jgi:phage terminase small subunit
MPRRLTLKQKRFSDAYVKTGNATKAVLQTYDTQDKKSASVIGSTNMANPRIVTYIESILDNAGVSDIYLAHQLRTVIDNSLTKKALKKISPSDGLRGIEMAYRLRDKFPATRTQIDKREVSLKLHGKTPEELYTKLQEVQQEINTFSKLVKSKPNESQEVINET